MEIPIPNFQYKDRFENLFPLNSLMHDEVFPLGVVCFPNSEGEPCWNCGDITKWVDLSFEATLCSIQCWVVKNIEYENALRSTRNV